MIPRGVSVKTWRIASAILLCSIFSVPWHSIQTLVGSATPMA